jgi:hypothetical protein
MLLDNPLEKVCTGGRVLKKDARFSSEHMIFETSDARSDNEITSIGNQRRVAAGEIKNSVME